MLHAYLHNFFNYSFYNISLLISRLMPIQLSVCILNNLLFSRLSPLMYQATSNLSPYFHFGQLAPARAILNVKVSVN